MWLVVLFYLKVGGNMVFSINNRIWHIVFTAPNSPKLRRSDNSLTVGVTDGNDGCIYLSDALRGAFLRKVLCHELVHCFMFSYSIHISIQEEEYIADWVATYGTELITLLDNLLYTILKNRAA